MSGTLSPRNSVEESWTVANPVCCDGATGSSDSDSAEKESAPSVKFTDVSEVKASDEDGYLSRSMTIKANSKIVRGANLDQSCHQRDDVSAFVPRHWRAVARGGV